MKEIIYLDTDLMNSMLAQLDEGLINNFSLEQWDQTIETEGQQSSRGKNAGLNGSFQTGTGSIPGMNLNFGANIGNTGNETVHESRSILDSQKDILNKAFHDYALDVLTTKLIDGDFLSHGPRYHEGDIYLGEASYRFYDFDLIKKAMNQDFMKQVLLLDIEKLGLNLENAKKILRKNKPTAQEREKMETASIVIQAHDVATPIIDVFEKMNLMSSFASSLLEDLTLIKANNEIGLLKKKYLRESAESLSFRTDKSRKVKYLVRVIGRKDEIYSEKNIPVIKENDIDIIPNMMLDLILGSFNIVEQGDLIVTPIAIYYE
jgi:hypothetical protein